MVLVNRARNLEAADPKYSLGHGLGIVLENHFRHTCMHMHAQVHMHACTCAYTHTHRGQGRREDREVA